eukprot:jgi/Chlat1/4960/Chrsp32S04925
MPSTTASVQKLQAQVAACDAVQQARVVRKRKLRGGQARVKAELKKARKSRGQAKRNKLSVAVSEQLQQPASQPQPQQTAAQGQQQAQMKPAQPAPKKNLQRSSSDNALRKRTVSPFSWLMQVFRSMTRTASDLFLCRAAIAREHARLMKEREIVDTFFLSKYAGCDMIELDPIQEVDEQYELPTPRRPPAQPQITTNASAAAADTWWRDTSRDYAQITAVPEEAPVLQPQAIILTLNETKKGGWIKRTFQKLSKEKAAKVHDHTQLLSSDTMERSDKATKKAVSDDGNLSDLELANPTRAAYG